LFLKNILTN